MDFLFFFPYAVVRIMPILYAPQIINKLLQNPQIFPIPEDLNAFPEKLSYLKQKSANRVILLIAPGLVKLVKCKWMISRMDVFISGIWLFLYGPVYLVF